MKKFKIKGNLKAFQAEGKTNNVSPRMRVKRKLYTWPYLTGTVCIISLCNTYHTMETEKKSMSTKY
jgi:hypothetical protein